MNKWYVNVYITNKAFGGPEEGGWWYNYGKVDSSTECNSRKEAEHHRLNMNEYCNTMNVGRHKPSSVLCEGWYVAWIEDKPAEDFPKEIPYYE